MLLPGENELADILLNLTKNVTEQETTIPEQGKVLREMGELYLKDAIETGNGEQYVKASALINAALVRTEHEDEQKALQVLLWDIYKGFMKSIEETTLDCSFSVEELAEKTNANKDDLHAIRVEIDEMCENLKQYFESYNRFNSMGLRMGAEKDMDKSRSYISKFFSMDTGIGFEEFIRHIYDSFGGGMGKGEIIDQLYNPSNCSMAGLFMAEIMKDFFNCSSRSDDERNALKELEGFMEEHFTWSSSAEAKMKECIEEFFISSTKHEVDELIEIEEKIVWEVKSISLRVQLRMVEFLNRLWEQATRMFVIPSPCQYAVIGLGSLARQETTPYSDLEFALLIETESDKNKQYFKNLVYLFHLLILDLGETPIPAMAIESLNDFFSSDGDRFFDRITPCGLRLDGAMPWACKTPIGRKETTQKEPLDLIKTPEEMAALLKENNDLGQAYHVADTLCNSILIFGDSAVFGKYTAISTIAVSKVDQKEKAIRSLIQDYKQAPDISLIDFGAYNLKNKSFFYRFSSTFVENLRMYFTPNYQPNSIWKVLDHLLGVNVLSMEGTFNLKVQLAICYAFRLLSYYKNKGQYENFGFLRMKEVDVFCKERSHNPLKARSRRYIAYFQNDQPLKRLYEGINGMKYVVELFLNRGKDNVNNLLGETFIQFNCELENSPYSWFRNGLMLANLKWARSSKELPIQDCGEACFAKCLTVCSWLYNYPILLRVIDKMSHCRDCKCLSLLHTQLLVTKAILIKKYDLPGNLPKEANVLQLQESYRQKGYKNVRERFYLLIDISDLTRYFFNNLHIIQLSVIKDITDFLDDMATFEDADQVMVNVIKFYLVKNLITIYGDAGQPQNGIKLCQEQIDEYEKELGLESNCTRLAEWYLTMGELKRQCGLPLEALDYHKKCFDIHMYVYGTDAFSGCHAPECAYSSSLMPIVRHMAYGLAKLYETQHRFQDGIEVLTAALTKDGIGVEIKTDLDIKAMLLLRKYCNKFEKYEPKADQYLEEVLEVVIEKGQGHSLRPETVFEIVLAAYSSIIVLGLSDADGSLDVVIENIYKKYFPTADRHSPTKAEFLINLLTKLLNDKSFYKYFLERTECNFVLITRQDCPHPNNLCTWIGFFFFLCSFSRLLGSAEDLFLPPMFKAGMALLQQAELFCENVVIKDGSKTMLQMCLIYIDFNKARLMFFNGAYKKSVFHFQPAFRSSWRLNHKLRQYFPNCETALKVTRGSSICEIFGLNEPVWF